MLTHNQEDLMKALTNNWEQLHTHLHLGDQRTLLIKMVRQTTLVLDTMMPLLDQHNRNIHLQPRSRAVERSDEKVPPKNLCRTVGCSFYAVPEYNEEYLRNPRQFYSTSFLHDVLATEANS